MCVDLADLEREWSPVRLEGRDRLSTMADRIPP
jgi:hypothetical protein